MNGTDLGLLVLRIGVGAVFAAHGAQKAFGWWGGPGMAGWQAAMERMGLWPARFWALVSVAAELAGVLLAAGLFLPVVTAVLVGQVIVITLRVHLPKGFWVSKGGVEFALTLGAGVVALAAAGGGAASLDQLLGLTYAAELRAGLLVLGVVGGLVALALPRLGARRLAAAQPR